MANKPHLNEEQCRLVFKREALHRRTSAKATARLLGVSYRVVRRVLEGCYLTVEQWETTLQANREAIRRQKSAKYFLTKRDKRTSALDKRMNQSDAPARVVG